MATVFDVNPHQLIGKLKEELKKTDAIKAPEWAKFVKTGSMKNKPPEQDDFWYIRAASILRQLYIQGRPLGVQRLRVKYGGKKKKKSIEKALEDILGDVNVRVPTDIPEILKYTGLDGYLGGENLDGTVFDLPHEIDTNQSYYGGEFAGKNGPLVALPIVISYNNGKGKGEGVIGKIGLVKVVAIE